MKNYIVLTNVWGQKLNVFGTHINDIQEEREEFDTLDEANNYIELFEGFCKTYERPKHAINMEWWQPFFVSNLYGTGKVLGFDNCNQRLWGYVLASSSPNKILKIGGEGLLGYPKKTNKLAFIDKIFRGKDEIPEDYKWDKGEYEGWLQFRWGDGKNAINYVESSKPQKAKEDYVDEEIESIKEWENDVEDYDEIEDSFMKHEDKEKLKILAERW